jgi:hypothetical protein
VLRTWEAAAGIAPAVPEVIDNLDADESIRIIAKVEGAPSRILKIKSEVDKIRQNRARAQQAQAQQEQQMVQAQGQKLQAEADNAQQNVLPIG